MLLPLVPIVLLGLGAAGLAWASLAKRPGSMASASAADLAQRVANKGPNGEWVFKPEFADSIVRSLSGQSYMYTEAGSREVVKIAPDPTGRPIPSSNTAMAWAHNMNARYSILAPLYMATATPQDRFLRAVPSGSESEVTGPETGYAVLLYAGAIAAGAAPPGKPPGGGAITPIPVPDGRPGPMPPGPLPGPPDGRTEDPAWRAQIKAKIEDLIANGKDPVYLDAVASWVERYGFVTEAARLRAKAQELRDAQRRVVPPPPPPPQPDPPRPYPTPPLPTPPLPIPPLPIPPPVLKPQFARVTTSDPPPLGDLKIRSGPSATSTQTGGAAKDSIVAVLQWNADGANQWSRIISTSGGQNWPPGTGFVMQRYLKPAAAPGPIPAPPDILPFPPLPFPPKPGPTPVAAQQARVTTSSASPLGDLKIRVGPSTSSPQVYGALKDSLVDVLQWNAASADGYTWARIRAYVGQPGGWGPGEGYAAQNFLVLQPRISGIGHVVVPPQVGGRTVTVVSSSGVRLRDRPGAHGSVLSLIPSGTALRLLKMAPGQRKADPRAPGPPGWALVEYCDTSYGGKGRCTTGWVQAEWLALH